MIKYELQEVAPNQMLIRIAGELIAGQESQSLRDALTPLVPRFATITLDLAGLRKMDSSGIGVLTGAKALADSMGHKLHAVNISAGIRDLLLLVKLLTFLEEPEPAGVSAG